MHMHVALASDNNYVQHLAVTLVSILENNSSVTNIDFHIFENQLSDENKSLLRQLIVRPEYKTAKIKFYNIEDDCIRDFPEISYLSKSAYLRLFIPDLLPQNIEKVIYLDCDLVVLKDLQSLYKVELKDRPLGAVEDPLSREVLRTFFYPGLQRYFNSGVLLINPQAWRNLNSWIQVSNANFCRLLIHKSILMGYKN